MTSKQVALVQDSFAKVALTSQAAAVLFYDRLFDIAPQMKAMFPDDMIEQRRKLRAMLAGVVLCQEGARAPCCTRDEGGPFGAVL